MTEAVVFGLYETGLGVIRSLGNNGIEITGIDFRKDIAWHSRYVTPLLCPHPVNNEVEFINWVLSKFSKDNIRRPAFITSDDFLMALSKNRELLEKCFIFNLVEHTLLLNITDKYQQYVLAKQVGIPVPGTFQVNDAKELKAIKKDLNYPLFLKGKDVTEWRSKVSASIKGYQVNNEEELEKHIKKILNNNVTVIVQEIIQGPDNNHYKYCCYISESGKLLAEFNLQKIRQNPIHFGIGSVVESVYDDELSAIGRKLLKGIGFRGVASIEFKRDIKDGKYKLIEINPRYWQQNSLTTFCNINFALINYNDLLEEKSDSCSTYVAGRKWINMFSDFNSFTSYRKLKEISLSRWIVSLKGPKIYSTFCWYDLKPFLCEINYGLRVFRIPLYMYNKFISRK